MKQRRIDREKHTVRLMIELYCRHKEGNIELCVSCKALINYALARLDRCCHGDSKEACQHCSSHCYKPEMREHIRRVMRYSGPRMIFFAPFEAIRHLFGK